MRSYSDSPEIAVLLKDAERVKILSEVSNNPYGQAVLSVPQQETKILYRSAANSFILHCAFECGSAPEERVLRLPADLDPNDCLTYESEHKKDYSPWFRMVEVDDTKL